MASVISLRPADDAGPGGSLPTAPPGGAIEAPGLREVTPPSRWTGAWQRRLESSPRLPVLDALDVRPGDEVVALVAHPDDETLAMGAALAGLTASGVRVRLVTLTSGEAALDHVRVTAPRLAERRRTELHRASAVLGIEDLHCLGLPDSGLAGCEDEAVRRAADVLTGSPARVLTTWRHDPHPDHQAAGRVALRLAADQGCPVTELTLWAPHWAHPADLPGHSGLLLLDNDDEARQRRERALACYTTQLLPLAPGLGPVLPPDVLAWRHEVVVLP